MKLIVVGNGKVGQSLIRQLYSEGHDITVIDKKIERLEEINNELDVLCINGDGVDNDVLIEAGVENTDLVIAVTSSDELNIVCSLISKKLGAKHVVSRIRSKEYIGRYKFLKEDLNIDLPVNPELRTAKEIANQFKFVGDFKIDTFAKGLAEMLSFRLSKGHPLIGRKLIDIDDRILVCAVEREESVIIPSGDFKLERGDKLYIILPSKYVVNIQDLIGTEERNNKSVLIVGGGKITYYLCKELLKYGMDIKIIDNNKEVCENLAEIFPSITIIHGDATNPTVLEEEGIFDSDTFIALTGNDEINIILSLFAKAKKLNKIISKVNNNSYNNLIKDYGLTNIFSPREVITDLILTYVRTVENIGFASADYVHRFVNNKVEALEFQVPDNFKYIGIPLKNLILEKDILVAGVVRNGEFIVADGNLDIKEKDRIMIISFEKKIKDLRDIIRG